MIEEKYIPVLGYEGRYEVSPDGNIRSIRRVVKKSNDRFQVVSTRILKPSRDGNGYSQCVLFNNDGRKSLKIHRIVLESFKGIRPYELTASHIDGDKLNNHIDNLVWESMSDNNRRKTSHGTSNYKLTIREARMIRLLFSLGGITQRRLALAYKVDPSTIYSIIQNKTWK